MRYLFVILCLSTTNTSHAADNPKIPFTRLGEAGLSRRCVEGLIYGVGYPNGNALRSLEEVQILTETELFRIPNVGRGSIREIANRLAQDGLQLGLLSFLGFDIDNRLLAFRLGVREPADVIQMQAGLRALDLDSSERETLDALINQTNRAAKVADEASEGNETSVVSSALSLDPRDQPFEKSGAFEPDTIASLQTYADRQGVDSLTLGELSLIEANDLINADVIPPNRIMPYLRALADANVQSNLLGMVGLSFATRLKIYRVGVRTRADFATIAPAIRSLDLSAYELSYVNNLAFRKPNAPINQEDQNEIGATVKALGDAYNTILLLNARDRGGHLNVHRDSLEQLQLLTRALSDCAAKLEP